MSAVPAVRMRDLELEDADLLAGRETLYLREPYPINPGGPLGCYSPAPVGGYPPPHVDSCRRCRTLAPWPGPTWWYAPCDALPGRPLSPVHSLMFVPADRGKLPSVLPVPGRPPLPLARAARGRACRSRRRAACRGA